MKTLLNQDCFVYLTSFCHDLRDIVKLWIALGCWRDLDAGHFMWREILSEYLLVHESKLVDDVILRIGCRLDVSGLLLIERMYCKRKCNRSGCLQEYMEIDNNRVSCAYHTGSRRRGFLSCCRVESFKDPGCKTGYHDGSLYEALFSKRENEITCIDKDMENLDLHSQAEEKVGNRRKENDSKAKEFK